MFDRASQELQMPHMRVAGSDGDRLLIHHGMSLVPTVVFRAHLTPEHTEYLKRHMPEEDHEKLDKFCAGGKTMFSGEGEEPGDQVVSEEAPPELPADASLPIDPMPEESQASVQPQPTTQSAPTDLLDQSQQAYEAYKAQVPPGLDPYPFETFLQMQVHGDQLKQQYQEDDAKQHAYENPALAEAAAGQEARGNAPQASGNEPGLNTDLGLPPKETVTDDGFGANFLKGLPGFGDAGDFGTHKSLKNSAAAVKDLTSAIQEQERIKGEFALQQARNREFDQVANNERGAKFQAEVKDRETHANQLEKDLDDTKIDQGRYWQSLGTGNQVAASIAVILSGIGSGITKQRNYALDQIRDAIDKDVDEQKAQRAGKATMLDRYLKETGNIEAAEQYTKADMYREQAQSLLALGDRKDSALSAPNAAASAAQLKQLAAQHDLQGATVLANIHHQGVMERLAGIGLQQQQLTLLEQHRAMLEAAKTGDQWWAERQAAMKNPKQVVPDEQVVGTDSSGRPITQITKQYLHGGVNPEKASEALESARDITHKFAALAQFTKDHPMGGIGWEQGAQGQNLATDLSLSLNKILEGNNRLNGPELEMIKGIVGNPTSWWQTWTGQEKARIKQLGEAVANKVQGVRDTYLIPGPPRAR